MSTDDKVLILDALECSEYYAKMSEKHTCQACITSCIDFRFQTFTNNWIKDAELEGQCDRVSIAGSIFDLDAILKQLEISVRLHEIQKVVFINHENCGAYGEAGTYDRHISDLKTAKETVLSLYPTLTVETYYMYLDGHTETID